MEDPAGPTSRGECAPGEAALEDPRYLVALEEARAAVAEQSKALDAIRTRMTTVVATGGVLSGLMVGLAFNKTTGHADLSDLGWVGAIGGAVAFGVLLVLFVVSWWPWSGWVFVRDARILLEDYVEHPVPVTIDELRRAVALSIQGHYELNRPKLERMGLLVGAAAALLALELAGFFVMAASASGP